jgi:hypothetical protein
VIQYTIPFPFGQSRSIGEPTTKETAMNNPIHRTKLPASAVALLLVLAVLAENSHPPKDQPMKSE